MSEQGLTCKRIIWAELASGVNLFTDLADHAITANIIRGRFATGELAFLQ